MSLQTKFRSPDEFLTELAEDKERIERKILRLSICHMRDPNWPSRVQLTALATCIVDDRLLCLQHVLGECLDNGLGEPENLVWVKGYDLIDRLAVAAHGLGLSVRAGVIEEAPLAAAEA